MELQEKLVEGQDAARTELQQREDVLAHGEEQLPEPVVEAVEDASFKMRGELLGAIRMILHRQTFEISALNLPFQEMEGLRALQVAVSGRQELAHFVYAEDRRALLEQALAVLQPNLSRVDDSTARELHAQLEDLTTRVAELREELTDLEDAQDELVEGRQTLEAGAEAPGDTPKPKPSDPDAPRPPTTLTGPDRPDPARPGTTLTGPDRPEPASAGTTLSGPDRPEPARPGTTLSGPDRPEPPRPGTTLTGPERPPEAAPVSSLGDAEESAAKPKRPWWRRPFG